MTDEKRPYHKKRRAELEAETRLRITESAVELHGTVGPARTSVSAVAEHAGVRRSTVYRHFPDEAALFRACSSHYREAHPMPDLAGWAAIGEPDERLRSALAELYACYRSTERMMENLVRDQALVPSVKRQFSSYYEYLGAAREVLMAGRPARGRGRQLLAAAIGLSLSFSTWRSLTREQGLDDARVADLMCRLVRSG